MIDRPMVSLAKMIHIMSTFTMLNFKSSREGQPTLTETYRKLLLNFVTFNPLQKPILNYSNKNQEFKKRLLIKKKEYQEPSNGWINIFPQIKDLKRKFRGKLTGRRENWWKLFKLNLFFGILKLFLFLWKFNFEMNEEGQAEKWWES